MDSPDRPAAPESGTSDPLIPDFAELKADPEIAPLLDFDPVHRKIRRPDGWTPELQRELIARLATTGALQAAVWQMGKHATGAEALYKTPAADSFRAAWDAALAIGRRRNGFDSRPPFLGDVPGVTRRKSRRERPTSGEVLERYGEAEHESSLDRRLEEARDSICAKLRRARRFYLHEISDSPGKRAAFEILTELPIDWDKAAAMQPQDDEPWRTPTMRKPEMLLTAENDWLGGFVHGPDKLAELRRAIDEHRADEGLEPVDWDESAEPSTSSSRT